MMPSDDKNKPTLQGNTIELRVDDNSRDKNSFLNISCSISKASSNDFILVL